MKASHTPTPWFKYQQWPDRFSIGAYRRGSLCIDIGAMIPRDVVTASGDESVSEEEALANVDIAITAVNHHQDLITRLDNLVNAVYCLSGVGEPGVSYTVNDAWAKVDLAVSEARETLKKVIP